MTASSPQELAALRARAYGPRADIDTDPAALARLRELEDAERAASREPVPAPEATETSTAVGSSRDEPTFAELVGVVPADAPMPEPERRTAPRAPRPIALPWIVAWATSVLVVAVAVGAIVFGLASIRPVSPETGATQIASLTEPIPSGSVAWVQNWFGSPDPDAMVMYRYLGLIVVKTPVGMYQQSQDCLMVGAIDGYNEADQSFQGNLYSGCRAGDFPATVQFVVDGEAPDELRDRFADGTGLSFVLRGDIVGVFVDGGPAPTATPTPTASAND